MRFAVDLATKLGRTLDELEDSMSSWEFSLRMTIQKQIHDEQQNQQKTGATPIADPTPATMKAFTG